MGPLVQIFLDKRTTLTIFRCLSLFGQDSLELILN